MASMTETILPTARKRSYPRPQVLYTWILNWYLVIELLPPLSMGLFLFAGALMLISIRDILDVILLSGAPFLPIMKTLLCLFPPLLTVSLPIGCLLAAMLVYGRLVEDRELTAMRAAGVGTLTLALPALVVGACLTVLNLLWTSYVTPRALELMKESRWEIVQKMTSISWLKPGQFTPLQEDLAFYFTGSEQGTNTIHDITIFKSGISSGPSWFGDGGTNEEASNWTVSAPTAMLVPDPAKGILRIALYNCISENLSPAKLSRVLVENATITIDIGGRLAKMLSGFSREQKTWSDFRNEAEEARTRYEDLRHHLGFSPGTPHGEVLAEANRWMGIEQKTPGSSPLAGGMFDLQSVKSSLRNTQVSINRAHLRLAYPVATFLFMMIGTALGILTGSGNRTISLLITVAVLIFYYSVQRVAEGISENIAMTQVFDPGYAVWAPNFILMLLGLSLIRMVAKR
jgi:lipopolysaccharide export LptBFGC system permease protein LptF